MISASVMKGLSELISFYFPCNQQKITTFLMLLFCFLKHDPLTPAGVHDMSSCHSKSWEAISKNEPISPFQIIELLTLQDKEPLYTKNQFVVIAALTM